MRKSSAEEEKKKTAEEEKEGKKRKKKKRRKERLCLENQEAKSDRKLGDRLEKPVSGSYFSLIFFLFFS